MLFGISRIKILEFLKEAILNIRKKVRQEEKEKERVYIEENREIKKLRRAQYIYRERALHATKKKKNISQSDWKIKDSSGIEKRLFRVSKQLENRAVEKKPKFKKSQKYIILLL